MNKIQIDNLLRSEVIGRVGCSVHDKVYVVPITYVYDGANILAHTAVGLKVDMMRSNPNVCFEVDHVYNMANWQSVVMMGTYEELKGKEAEETLQQIINRMHPLISSETSVPRHNLERPRSPLTVHIELVVFKIRINEATGKFEKQ